MAEITGNLTADAIVRELIFRDDFSRVVAVGLGGPWSWHWEDSGHNRSDESNASVDGSVARATSSDYVSYVGIPVPATGEANFDFLVPAQWTNQRPTYGLLLDASEYTGVYVGSNSIDGVWRLFQYGNDSPYVFTPEASTWYRIRAVWDGTNVRSNVWKRDDPEPSGWQYEQPQQFVTTSTTDEPGMLDIYYASPYEDTQLDNVEIWSHEPQWVAYGGTQLDAALVASPVKTFDAGAWITAWTIPGSTKLDAVLAKSQVKSFSAGAWIDVLTRWTAHAIIKKTWADLTTTTFADDFERSVTGGLGNGWVHDWGGASSPNVAGGCWVQPAGTYSAWNRSDLSVAAGANFDSVYFDFYFPPWSEFQTGWSPYAYMEFGGTWFDVSADNASGPILTGGVRLGSTSDSSVTFQDDTWYTFRIAQIGGVSKLKFWKRDQPEPDNWSHTAAASGTSSWPLAIELDGVNAGVGKLDNVRLSSSEPVGFKANAIVHRPDRTTSFQAEYHTILQRVAATVPAAALVHRTIMATAPVLEPLFVGATRATSWSPKGSLTVATPAGAVSSDYFIAVVHTDSQGGGIPVTPNGWAVRATVVYPDGSRTVVYRAYSWFGTSLTFGMSPNSGFNVILLAFRNVSWLSLCDSDSTNQSPYDIITAPALDANQTGMLVSVFASSSWGPGAMTPPAGMTEAIDSTDYYVQLSAAYLPITDAAEAAIPRTAVITNPDSGSPWRTGFSILLTQSSPTSWTRPGISVGAAIYRDIPVEPTIAITLDGVDITDDVFFEEAEFTSQVSGAPGSCKFRIKDLGFGHRPVVGRQLTLDIDGKRVWGGWATKITRQHLFPTTTGAVEAFDPCLPSDQLVPRIYVIEGVDYNILFRKRFVVRKSKPTNAVIKTWPEDTPDDVMVDWLCRHNLYLEGDQIDYETMVDNVGTPNPDAKGNPAGPGYSWEQAMRAIARLPGAIFYINPDRQLVYTDVDTRSNGYALTDDPKGMFDLGYRDMEILNNGSNLVNDAMVWGAGQGSSKVKFSRVRDSTSMNDHGLWQVGDFRTDMYRQASVDKRANSFVYGSPQNKRGGKDDAISVMVTLFKPVFRVADKVQFTSTVFGYSDVLPVRRMRISFPTNKDAKFSLVLSHSIDEPWDTSEFWFPRPRFDPIIIEPGDGGGDPYCPVPVLSGDPNTIDDLDIPEMTLVFADDMSRRSVFEEDLPGGIWDAGQSNYQIADDRIRISTNGSYPMRLFLDAPVAGNMQVILKLDLTSAITSAAPATTGTILSFENDAGQLFTIWANGDVSAGKLVYTEQAKRVKPTFDLRTKVFVRLFINRDFNYTAMKIWPQAEIEPAPWTTVQTGTSAGSVGKITFWKSYESVGGIAYLEAIAIWGSVSSNDEADGGYPLHPLATGNETGNISTNGGWTRGFDCTGNKSGIDGADGTVGWQTDTLTHSGNGSCSFGAVADYFDPKKGFMHYASASVGVIDFSYGAGSTYPPIYANTVPSPSRISISGTINGSCNKSTGIGIHNRTPQQVGFSIELYIIAQSFVDANTAPGFYPYSAANARVIKTVYVAPVTNSPQSTVRVPFTAMLPFNEYIDPFGYALKWFYIGVRIQGDPEGILSGLDYSGGPFMFPNTIDMGASVTVTKLGFDYGIVGNGEYFCVPAGQVEGATAKAIKTIIVDADYLRRLYSMKEPWSVRLDSAYVPTSVSITADGLDLVSGYDFIEEDPATGLVTFVRSMLNVSEVVMYYLPSS